MNESNKVRKRGRPPKNQNEAKAHAIRVRMNDEEWKELQELSEKAGLSMSECMRLSVHYQLEKFPKVDYFNEIKNESKTG